MLGSKGGSEPPVLGRGELGRSSPPTTVLDWDGSSCCLPPSHGIYSLPCSTAPTFDLLGHPVPKTPRVATHLPVTRQRSSIQPRLGDLQRRLFPRWWLCGLTSRAGEPTSRFVRVPYSRLSGAVLAYGARGRGEGELPGLSCGCPLIPTFQVVLIPGLLIPAIIWKNVAPQLASHGFRVLLYGVWIQFDHRASPKSDGQFPDLYGRGFSDAPSTTYNPMLYTTQLALLLQYLGWRNTNVAGVSMASVSSFPPLLVT